MLWTKESFYSVERQTTTPVMVMISKYEEKQQGINDKFSYILKEECLSEKMTSELWAKLVWERS